MSELVLRGAWQDGVFGDVIVWRNPVDLGHAFIKLRKQSAENRIIERMERRQADAVVVAAVVGGTRLD